MIPAKGLEITGVERANRETEGVGAVQRVRGSLDSAYYRPSSP